MTEALYGLIEAGGTKFVLATATEDRKLVSTKRLATETPDITIPSMLDWFEKQPRLAAFGMASFGPVEIDRNSNDWGRILKTPKPGWSDTHLVAQLQDKFGTAVGFDTDVNAAALAEFRWGAGQGGKSSVYFTIGTGIGAGAIIGGKILSGLGHPEIGHIPMQRHPADMEFSGHCPFHGDCLEGLASGPAIIARWGASLSDLPQDHPAKDIIAWYLAKAAIAMQATLAADRIIFGGGVMQSHGMLSRVVENAASMGAGYFRGKAEDIICSPGLGTESGLMGALALALDSQ